MADLFMRSYPLEDIRILSRAQGSEYADGRTVEARVAVWDREAEVQDGQGHYMETIGRTAFDKAIQETRPQGARTNWRVGVFFNHGQTLYGTPSESGSMPIGTTLDVRSDPLGLVTLTRYNETRLAEETLEAIRTGALDQHSFSGRFIKSDPVRPPRGGFRANTSGSLPLVRRLELGLREYGPTPFGVYADTPVLSIRALQQYLSDTPPEEDEVEPPDSDTPEDKGAVTDEPPAAAAEHSSRDSTLKRAELMRRIAAARHTRPGLARQKDEP